MKVVLENGVNGVLMNVVADGTSVTKYVLRSHDVMWQGNRAIVENKEKAILIIAELKQHGYSVNVES